MADYTSKRPDWRDRLNQRVKGVAVPVLLLLRREPAMFWTGLLATAAAVLVYFTPGWSTDQHGAVVTIATAAGAVVTALLATPRVLAPLTGVITTILAALASFGLHLPAKDLATTVTAVGLFTGLLLRGHLTPDAPPPAPAVHA